ncbi:hypothetical protein A3I51_03975 [Candidatus Gottesmanbacteria bacterium RIFCSPLOWO2_02_FULL_38_8]|uniref:Glycosyltransferase RgtA/B/C/D-like domain-containing protein n=1 Tax=Candidatus Gottesmanbacteria bacterium RIFCSPLOWO2_02_FULL_38_8 TaxID=1798397 RepID=A0A1F6B526_9BACT|nr:MAG: hypothetical protein A3I51_03975 [Candidatus Gottesmanbacteria bacterium RIFCSPLOWO2_02_FULL_38_8]
MNKKFLIFLLLAFFIKEFIWIILVPLWHFPDEQAHFAQVAYLAEKGNSPNGDNNDLTKEIYLSEELLGTKRDRYGNNKFTFHPEYRIPYSNNLTGLYEREILFLAKDLKNRQMVGKEASRYPPLYYILLAVLYKIFYFNNLINRVFLARIFQIIFYIGTVYISFKTVKVIFSGNSFLSYSLTLLVAFQPMFSFVSAGINSDNISNFIFSVYLFISLKLIKSVFSRKYLLALILTTLLGIYAKPQFYITLPLSFLLIFYKIITLKTGPEKRFFKAAIYMFIIFLILTFFSVFRLGPQILLSKLAYGFDLPKFLINLKTYAFPHLYREVLPWYWGVYNWLGVTYPRIVHRIINWLILLSLIGFIFFFIRNRQKINRWPVNGIIYLLFANLAFFLGVYLFDWLQFVESGFKFHLGVQGRYFFPLIISHLLFILIGWRELFQIFPLLLPLATKLLVVLMFILHWYALYLIALTYYDLSLLSVFIIQASQYKPWFFKGNLLLTQIFFSLTVNLAFLLKYLKIGNLYGQDKNR